MFLFTGLVGLMTCIRREIGNASARYIFIQDKNAPKFDLSIRFYAEQLDKGLMANVLKTRQWVFSHSRELKFLPREEGRELSEEVH